MDFPHGETVTVLVPATKANPYNSAEQIPDPAGAPTSTTYPRCAVWQESSTEPLADGRTAVVTTTKAALPAGAVVPPGASFTARGVTYRVEGEPEDVRNPFTGWTPGVVVTGVRVDG